MDEATERYHDQKSRLMQWLADEFYNWVRQQDDATLAYLHDHMELARLLPEGGSEGKRVMSTITDMRPGTWIDGYQAVSPAPVEFIKGDRHRYIGGQCVKGAWSDPWWLYDPARGWAVARLWRNKGQRVFSSEPGSPFRLVGFPAREERQLEPWTPEPARELVTA